MSIEYWVTCALDPWPALAEDEAFGEIVGALLADGEYRNDDVELTLEEAAPSFVPVGQIVLRVSGPSTANWDEVMEFLDAMAAVGDGVVFSEDRQIVLDRRSIRPGVKAFNEQPAWATALAAKWPDLHVVVEGTVAVANPSVELGRVGLAALASRVTVTAQGGTLQIRAAQLTDALVAGQALSHAARGPAFAVAGSGAREELPR